MEWWDWMNASFGLYKINGSSFLFISFRSGFKCGLSTHIAMSRMQAMATYRRLAITPDF